MCTHPELLQVVQDETDFTVHYGRRLDRLAKNLPYPDRQQPSVVYFLGKTFKNKVIQKLFPNNYIPCHRQQSIANAFVDINTINNDNPTIIFDTSLTLETPRFHPPTDKQCHEVQLHTISPTAGQILQLDEVVKSIRTRLIFLFSDVICLFSADYGGFAGVVAILTTWAELGSASKMPKNTLPRVVVVMREQDPIFSLEATSYKSRLLSIPDIRSSFSTLKIINIAGVSRANVGYLSETLNDESQLAQLQRVQSSTLFTATHLSVLFERALEGLTRNITATFNPLTAARHFTPINPDFGGHLTACLKLCKDRDFFPAAASMICASAILMDAYPPGMHSFQSSDVYDALYDEPCLKAFAEIYEMPMRLVRCSIKRHLADLFSRMISGGQTSAALHAQNLPQLSLLRSNTTCLCCLQRKPEHSFDCGHMICDVCVDIYGVPVRGLEYHFSFSKCLFCDTRSNLEVRLLPPTCGARLISIDGGGCRGIIPLTYLDTLQDVMGLPYPIQHYFDFAIGTSSGALTVLALFAKFWTTKKSLEFYHRFAQRIFPAQSRLRGSFLAKFRKIFSSFLADGQYDDLAMEANLREAFGTGLLFGPNGTQTSGMKLAVTATTISDATLCLFSNYNGSAAQGGDFRCKRFRAQQASEEIQLWEAARCTTAAPWFFKPKKLLLYGTFQDGALKYNSPVKPGMRAVRDVWKDGECDLVVSMGTGFQVEPNSPRAPHFRNLFQDGALMRLYRASMSSLSLSGENNWRDHFHGLEQDTRAHHFRLDLPLNSHEPRIDEVDKMVPLQELARSHVGDLKDLTRAFKAASFFFELNVPLIRRGHSYICYGSILSRSPDSRSLIENFALEFPHANFVTDNDTVLGGLSDADLCVTCGRYQKSVAFQVRHPSEVVNIQLAFNKLFLRGISSFPRSMEWFEKKQMIHAPFGRPNHKNTSPSAEDNCVCFSRRKSGEDSPVPGKRPAAAEFGGRRKRRRM